MKAIEASKKLAIEYGEPELLKGYGQRNTTLIALAPTTSSSSILGQVSPSIEPYKSNYYVVGLAKGSFPRKNKELESLLEAKEKNTKEIWDSILLNKGSVQHLDCLSDHEKDVFKTFEEISPLSVIQQAGMRQKYICQGQSLNLMIPNSVEIKQINAWVIEAWKLGVKGLYYQRGTSVAKEAVLKMLECASCEG
jgi:ribonucleoside-diphosphate reductase alpha chain